MSKVTIKFWDKYANEYIESYKYGLFTDGVTVYEAIGSDYSNNMCVEYKSFVEPHFFKDGERIK